jgi:opacity protein-like surface antigen
MGWVRTSIIAGVVLGASASLAEAADMPGYPPPLPPPPVREVRPVLLDFSTGWYLRGDLGYYWGKGLDPETTAPFSNPTNSSYGKGYTVGGGFGYKSRWLRTDVTIDYMAPMDYTGSAVTADDTTAKIQATTALFNGYIDLGTWYRITPYIGGGVGAAYVSVYDYISTGAPPFAGDHHKDQWKFAWALTSGVAIAVAPNLMIDAGYRYLNLGDVATGSDAIGSTTFKNVAAHEVRVGLRWSFDDIYVPR